MKYSKENVIGLCFEHRDSTKSDPIGYRVVGFSPEGIMTTINIYTNKMDTWPIHTSIQDVNRWLENGIWIPKNGVLYDYSIF